MNALVWVSFGIAILDQVIKLNVRRLPVGQVFFRIPNLFELTVCVNTGAAFSILRGRNTALILLSAALLLFCIVYIKKKLHLTKPAVAACMFLLGGSIGNLIDRICFGGVTDYIRLLFMDFPVFNFADIVITCSVFVLTILLLTNRLEETTGENHG